ncbi:hypothetical protein ACF0H5_001553 [Mactra antiquata]
MYEAFRKNGEPTYYEDNHTPWQADILESGFIFAGCILALAFFCILPGIQGKSRLFTLSWIVIGVSVGTIIVVINYSPHWEVAETSTVTKYKAGTGKDIHAHVGLNIGLRGINITLKGTPVHQLNETINYNEHFGWSWRQGRNFFGPFASEFNQAYRAAQFRGLPLPILWIAEYFTLDGEGLRWGRLYREAGLYAHSCLWLALVFWVLANILLFVLIRYGAYLIIFTGLSLCTSTTIKHFLRTDLTLAIPFSAEHILRIHYGPAFWLCLVTGGLCLVSGFIILVIDLRLPSASAAFFGMDILQDENQIQVETLTKKDDSNLTEIVEVDKDGKVVKKIDVRPVGAPKAGSKVTDPHTLLSAKDLDNVYGDYKDDFYDDFSNSDSDLSATDEEYNDAKTILSETKRKGFIQRLQVNRRVPSARPPSNKTTSTISSSNQRVTRPRVKKTAVVPIGTQRRK